VTASRSVTKRLRKCFRASPTSIALPFCAGPGNTSTVASSPVGMDIPTEGDSAKAMESVMTPANSGLIQRAHTLTVFPWIGLAFLGLAQRLAARERKKREGY